MAVEVRPYTGLGKFQIDWLNASHHFSFGQYYDPGRMGVGPLRVWNDDEIAPQSGFDPHPHRDMEIVTYVRKGAITHLDSLGNQGRTPAGDVQVMSAGTGIRHAEYNREDETTTIFQIWIQPRHRGLEPRWAQRAFPKADRAGQLVVLASGRQGDDDALPIDQDAAVLGATLEKGQKITHRLGKGRQAYIVGALGSFTVNGKAVKARDGVMVRDADEVVVEAGEPSEILVADLP
ncbi:MAG TPA: pirin family protein [Geminicoccaceae bacterium]|nr:pirin family protein [Geminicoccus sp.]HMU48362.1 pirin family protein [Geminicoccaceae bacterium]